MEIQMDDSSTHFPSYCIYYCNQICIEHTLTNEFGLSCMLTLLTLIVSIYHITMHLQNFNNPFFQSKIIVIMIMAPFYCVTSMGSFIWPLHEPYFTLIRDFYEAILLFTFFYLIFSYLAYDRDEDKMQDKTVYLIMINHQKQVHHFFPFNLCQKPYQLASWKKAKYFTYRCKKYVLQFLIVKVVTTLIMCIVYPNIPAHQDQDEIDSSTYVYVSGFISFTIAISASYSLYYLVLFYHVLHKPLSPYSPLLKFLTIKITLFFTFWQRIMIVILEEQFLQCFDEKAQNYVPREIISSLENTLICVQMFIMAFAGGLAYDYNNYISRVASKKGSLRQVFNDTIRTFKKDSRLIKPKRFGFDSYHYEEVQLHTLSQDRQSAVVESTVMIQPKECLIEQYF